MYVGKSNLHSGGVMPVKSPLSQTINRLQSLISVKAVQRNFDTVGITSSMQQKKMLKKYSI